jgi:hypothetical protein
MAHRPKIDDFITQGLRRYPEARATVRAFQSALAGRIEECIARRNWRAWKPDAEGFEPYRGGPQWDGAGVIAGGRMKNRGAKTDLWVYVVWSAPIRTFRLDPWPRPVWLNRDLALPKIAGGIAVRADRTGFYVISDSPDLDRICARLLATFDACASAAVKPRKR